MNRIILLIACIIVGAPLWGQNYLDSLDNKLQDLARRSALPGFSVAIVDQDRILFEKGYGYADLDNKTPYTPHTVQNIGSISKTFIGIALQQAVEDGILNWDDPINKYLDFEVIHPRFPTQPILLKHLANHTAGINDGKAYEDSYSLIDGSGYSKRQLKRIDPDIGLMWKHKPMSIKAYCQQFFLPKGKLYSKRNFTKYAPGEYHEYSNVGAALAAHVLEKASGKSFSEWTQERILTPLGMTNSGWSYDKIDPKTKGRVYGPNRIAMPFYTLATYPDGGMLSSAHQMGLYLSATLKGLNAGNKILSQNGYQYITQAAVPIPDDEDSYGYFWEIMSSGYTGHSGGDPGIVTLMFYEPKAKVGMLAFFNGTLNGGNGIYREIFTSVIEAGNKVAN